jgi:hypothetical protein
MFLNYLVNNSSRDISKHSMVLKGTCDMEKLRIKTKKPFICFIQIIFLLSCAQAIYAYPGRTFDTPLKTHSDGFRDMKWLDQPSKLGADARIVDEYVDEYYSSTSVGPTIRIYEKQKEDLVLGKARLKTIQYFFIRQNGVFYLYRVSIFAADEKNSALLEDYAIQAFGSYLVSDNKKMIYWQGSAVDAVFHRDLFELTMDLNDFTR